MSTRERKGIEVKDQEGRGGREPTPIEALSIAATTANSMGCTRDVDPRKIGYTLSMFERQFPGLDYDRVLESFHTFYIAKGEQSKNWFEKFLAYAQGALDRQRANAETGTDSLGRPLDLNKRRRVVSVPLTEGEEQEYLAKFKDDEARLRERRLRLERERKAQESW